jgi:hypothetical protein
MTKGMRENDEKLDALHGQIPLKRVSHPEEQAGMAVFYLSDYASCEYQRSTWNHADGTDMTGTQSIIDGGLSLW